MARALVHAAELVGEVGDDVHHAHRLAQVVHRELWLLALRLAGTDPARRSRQPATSAALR